MNRIEDVDEGRRSLSDAEKTPATQQEGREVCEGGYLFMHAECRASRPVQPYCTHHQNRRDASPQAALHAHRLYESALPDINCQCIDLRAVSAALLA